jgi:hypothetical protein
MRPKSMAPRRIEVSDTKLDPKYGARRVRRTLQENDLIY